MHNCKSTLSSYHCQKDLLLERQNCEGLEKLSDSILFAVDGDDMTLNILSTKIFAFPVGV